MVVTTLTYARAARAFMVGATLVLKRVAEMHAFQPPATVAMEVAAQGPAARRPPVRISVSRAIPDPLICAVTRATTNPA